MCSFTTIIASNKFWLMIRPMSVNFDILGHGKCRIEVQLSKKDDNEFAKVRSGSIRINLEDQKHADIVVNRAKSPKRVKLILSDLSSNEPIAISNVKFRDGKYALESIGKFKVDGAKVVKKDNKLVLIPYNSRITLTYPETLKFRAGIKFDFLVFSSILILVYLLAYKLSDYVADFSTIEGKSRVEIVFLTIFFVFLFIPMLHINQDDISRKENRTLAKWKPLVTANDTINFEFGNNFNEWFNDRFYLKEVFIALRSDISMLLANSCEKGLFDKNTKTLYIKAHFGSAHLDVIKDNFKALYDFNSWCNKHNIKLYVLIVPRKADIHTTKLNYVNDSSIKKAFLNYISEINREDKIKVIYPYSAMLNAVASGKQLYFKTEHHWTDDGAYVGYKELMEVINKDYPNIKVLDSQDFNYKHSRMVRGDFTRKFNYGDNCRFIGISNALCSTYHQYEYTYYQHKDFNNLEQIVIDVPFHRNKIYHYKKGYNARVILLGTSQSENLTEFIPYTFKDVKRIRNNSVRGVKPEDEFKIMKRFEKEMLDYKPDIIIFCLDYPNLWHLRNIFNME